MSKEIEDKWRSQMFAERVAEHDEEHPGYRKSWNKLRRKLLSIGGADVVSTFTADPLLDALLDEGQLCKGKVRKVRGRQSDCHGNAVRLWRKGKVVAIGSGYGLSRDGLWRQHSWARAEDGAILETTVRRTRYFGLEYSGDEGDHLADFLEG